MLIMESWLHTTNVSFDLFFVCCAVFDLFHVCCAVFDLFNVCCAVSLYLFHVCGALKSVCFVYVVLFLI